MFVLNHTTWHPIVVSYYGNLQYFVQYVQNGSSMNSGCELYVGVSQGSSETKCQVHQYKIKSSAMVVYLLARLHRCQSDFDNIRISILQSLYMDMAVASHTNWCNTQEMLAMSFHQRKQASQRHP